MHGVRMVDGVEVLACIGEMQGCIPVDWLRLVESQ
jgi:hypothetical protein